MAYEPDPLSVRYEPAAGRLLGQAIRDKNEGKRTWRYTDVIRPKPGPRTREWLRAHGITLDRLDSGGLTEYERAYQRALYRTAKKLGISTTFRLNPEWSLQREWGPVTARGRVLAIRLTTAAEARRAVGRKPRDEQWHRSLELRSGGIGSPHRRFS